MAEEQNIREEFEKDFVIEKKVHFRELFGLFEVVSAVPASVPTKFSEQIKIYKNGATRRIYWYDNVNAEWVYVAGSV